MKTSNQRNLIRGTTQLLMAFGLFVVLTGAECPEAAKPPEVKQGIEFGENTTLPYIASKFALVTQGESLTMPVKVRSVLTEEYGISSDFAISSDEPGITGSLSEEHHALPGNASDTIDLTANITIGEGVPDGDYIITVMRTGYASGDQLKDDLGLRVVNNLATVTADPNPASVPAGGSTNIDFIVRAVGSSSGVFQFTPEARDSIYHTFAPTPLTVTLIPGTDVHATSTLSVDATVGSGRYPYKVFVGDVSLGGFSYDVTTTTGNGKFSFTASPMDVDAPNGGTPSPQVNFTVTSINGFSGTIHISWSSDGESHPIPLDDEFDVSIAPGSPATFIRTFSRYVTGGQDANITYLASDLVGNSISKTITLHEP